MAGVVGSGGGKWRQPYLDNNKKYEKIKISEIFLLKKKKVKRNPSG